MTADSSDKKSNYITIALAIAVVLLAATLYASSQDMPADTVNTIHMNGYAEKQVVPDTATISIGAVVQAPTAKEASEENAAIMSAVIEELKDIGLEDSELQTSYVSVSPVYDHEDRRTIVAYSASNSVRITTKQLEIIGPIIDGSTASGANQIGSISFSVSDEMRKDLREELIEGAANDATSKAQTLASSLDVTIVGVKTSSISDGTGQRIYYDVVEPEEAADKGIRTPVQPGESTVSMSVQVTYIIR